MRSDGQTWAIEQLEEVVAASAELFEIIRIDEPANLGEAVGLLVSIDCSQYPRVEGGMPLRSRERLSIRIPSTFPLARPDARFTHKEYGDFAHVQWGDSICLYQAPEVEWVPGQGMFGFLERVNEWLRAAAANELDPAGMPLHPPVVYVVNSRFHVIPVQDTPQPEPPYWGGYVEVTRESDVAADLGRWYKHGEALPEGRLASAILLPTKMPHEYPTTVLDMIRVLGSRGVPVELMYLIVSLGVLRTADEKSAIFLLGSAMRGIAGAPAVQHLACWLIDPAQTKTLRQAVVADTPDDPQAIEAFCTWAAAAKIEWCRVLDDRPEIVERRDSKSIARFWQGKHVALLGCGAIGSTVAPMLARAGVARLQLYDNGAVTPGVLVRQDFRREQVGYTKSSAVKVGVLRIRPELDVSAYHTNVLELLQDTERLELLMSADVVIDATASHTVATALELLFRKTSKRHPPLITMAVGHNADVGLMTLVSDLHVGMSVDADRQVKLALGRSNGGGPFLEEFWPTDVSRRTVFQPEPGCSSPTFRGSYADVLGLTSRMTNMAASWLSRDAPGPRAFAFDLSGGGLLTGPSRELEFTWRPHHVLADRRHDFEIRLSADALAALLAWTRRSERVAGTRVETGGVLFGEVDELLKVIWVDEVSGPPPDSDASPQGFVCGTVGVGETNAEKVRRTSGSVAFVGMWHTHPHGLPYPSTTDLGAMRQLLRHENAYLGRRFLMMIVGGTSRLPIMSASVFQRADYAF